MATDWAADVKKYAPSADDAVIAGIVRYCGIALRSRDSALVAFSDPKELDRVRNNFLKKKLGLTQSDKVLDAAIAKVGVAMKADRTKNRVTVYYLLADAFKKLALFVKAPAKKAAAPAAKAAPAKKTAAKAAGVAALAGAEMASAKAPAKKAAAPAAKAAPAKKAAAPAAKAAPAKKAAAPAKKVAKLTAKAAPAKKAAAPQGLLDKATGAGAAVAAGTVAAAGAGAAAVTGAASSALMTAADTTAKVADAAAGVVGAAATGAAALATGTADKAASVVSSAAKQLSGGASDESDSGLGWLWWLLGLALLAFLAWWLFLRGPADEMAAPATSTSEAAAGAPVDLAAAPAEGTVEIPAGAGVTSELRDGKPVVKVYFDTGKVDVAPAMAGAAGGLKAWLEANPGTSLAISGYSDPSGNAAANAELAKNRAQAVQAALVAAGVAEASAELVKPDDTADATVPPEAARRVEVIVK